MTYIKPNWIIARQISRQHTLYSTFITVSLMLAAALVGFVTFKILGYSNGFAALKNFTKQYQKPITSCIVLVHLIPVNLYAIILTFRHRFRYFSIRLLPPDNS